MSHHLDTPLAARNGQLLIDDLYVFPGDGSTVFVMDVNSNVNGLHSEPGFHPEARYELKVHPDGADYEDLTFRVAFGGADDDGRQTLRMHTLTGGQAREDSAEGALVLETVTGETASRPGGVGPRPYRWGHDDSAHGQRRHRCRRPRRRRRFLHRTRPGTGRQDADRGKLGGK